MTDIVERLERMAATGIYPKEVREAAAEIERLRAALQEALIAMRLASALPGVGDEYDFEPAIQSVRRALENKP